MDATCAPVMPAPITRIDRGTSFKLHASLCVAVNSAPGTDNLRLMPPAHRMIRSVCICSPLSVSIVCASRKRALPARS